MRNYKKILSFFMAVIMLITSCYSSFFAFAVEDLTTGYDLQIYYYNEKKEFVEVTEQLPVMEQEDIQLYACLVYEDGTIWDITTSGMPMFMEDYTLEWHSDARYLAFCENQDGKIHGYDATKGEAIRNWLDNEVGTIPVVGESLKKILLGMLDNKVTDIDDLDTEDVVKILDKALETVKVDEEQRKKLTDSLADYLNKFDVGISAILRDGDGNELARDTVRVLVLKSSKFLSDVIPNAAFIKNYDSIPRTVAVGYEMDLDGIITPVRTHYDCAWTVTGQLGVLGSDLATVDENGHFTAIGEGTVQIKVSPDIEGLTKSLSDAFNKIAAAGELVDSETIAKAILLILGIKSDTDNYSTLVRIISTIMDSGVVGEDGILSFGDNVFKPLANFILYVIYQDSVTIKIVKPSEIMIESFDLVGDDKITEGETTTLSFANVKPDGAVPHDYTFTVENEEYAVQVDDRTFLGIDGSTWDANYVTSNDTKITCKMNGIEDDFKLRVFANGNKNVVYIKINCDQYLYLESPTDVEAVTYPKRAKNTLSYGWEYSDGSIVYATSDAPAYTEDGNAYVNSDGIMYATACTVNNVVVKEDKGAIQKKQIMSGIQTTGVEFTKKHFWKKADSGVISSGIRGSVCEVSANILPADASFKELTFTSADTESVILSASPLTTTQYASAVLTKDRRLSNKSVTVECDEDGYAVIYAYAVGNDACYSDITVTTQTGGFTDEATVAFANISVTDVTIVSDRMSDPEIYLESGSYQITAGETIKFDAIVQMSESGNWKRQGFEDVEWTLDNEDLAFVAQDGTFKAVDVGVVTLTATSVFGEISKSVSIKILPDYRALKAAMADCDYDNLDPYDWSYDSWDTFDAYYQEAVTKLAEASFVSQREVDVLTKNITESFNALVRYMPLTGLSIYCSDDADQNGFATIKVDNLKDYTKYSSTIVPTVYPEGAEDYKITYSCSLPDKMTVDENGVCRPTSDKDASWSKVTVTVTDPKNGNTFSQYIYVAFSKYQVTKASVDKTNIHFVGVGADAEKSSETITVSYDTDSALTKPSIKYGFMASSDESVATVDQNGVITPVGIGSCTITSYSYDGGFTTVTNVLVTTNKKHLQEAVDKADALVEEFYTEESYALVQTALVDAKAQLNDENATQENINIATANLEDALSKLVKNPYANVYITAGNGGSVAYDGNTYRGENNKVRVLIENGLNVTAVADSGYHFKHWKDANGNIVSTNETETFTIDYSAYFIAEFEEVRPVTGINAYAEGQDVEYYSVDVGDLSNYTKSSVQLSYDIYPQNANYYRVDYVTEQDSVTISSKGVVTPKENSSCYAVIDVVVTNTITGESFKDRITVAFAKRPIDRIEASPNEVVFNGLNAQSQLVTVNYKAKSSTTTPSVRRGFAEIEDDSIATVSTELVDDVGTCIRIYPKKIGSTRVKFTTYEGGKTLYVNVKVYADKSAITSEINYVDSIIKRNYTEDSYNNVIEKRDSAVIVRDTEYASQEDVDLATHALQEAISNLVELDLIEYDVFFDGEGTVTCGTDVLDKDGSFTIKKGDSATVTAKAADGYEFIGWYNTSDQLVSYDYSYTTVISGTSVIKAKFNKLVYVESIEMTAGGKTATFYTHDVGSLQDYSKQNVALGVKINPENPTHYRVEYKLGNDCVNLKLDGTSLHPESNSNAYGTVYVTVYDDSNGKVYTDYAVINFSKTMLKELTADKYSVVFNGENAESQLVYITYKSGSSSNPSTRRGFATIENEDVATVSTEIGDGTGTCMRIYPQSIGTTTAKFTAYDAGYTVTVDVKVLADKSALASVLDEAKKLNADDYTEESFTAIPSIIEYANGVNDTEFATQEEVDSATNGLISAMSALVKRDVITIKVSSIGNGKAELNGVENGTVIAERGQMITINSIPQDGYEVEAWYDEVGTLVSRNQSMSFIPDGSHTYIAKFRKIIYVESIVATCEGSENDFYTKTGFTGKYTNQSLTLGAKINPSNADDYTVSYKFIKSLNMSINGNVVTPSSDSMAYARVLVTVKDNKSGKTYTDEICVAISKNAMKSVSVSPTNISFASNADSTRTITASYTLEKTSTTIYGKGLPYCYYVSSDENVATVTDAGVVKPVGPGSCTITCYTYDGGKTARTTVTVGGNPSVSGKIVAMASPDSDTGTLGVEGATVSIGSRTATTNANGEFTIEGLESGNKYQMVIEYENGITRTVYVNVNSNVSNIVIPIVAVDYVNDGVINAKDYAKMRKDNASNELQNIFKNFVNVKSFTYQELTF